MYTIQQYKTQLVRESSTPKDRRSISSKKDVESLVKNLLTDQALEYVIIVSMDNGNRVLGYQMIEGAVNQCSLYPSNVMRFLLCSGAANFLIAHNHPGGSSKPSQADWNVTSQLQKAATILQFSFLDHLIIVDEETVSMRELDKWRSR